MVVPPGEFIETILATNFDGDSVEDERIYFLWGGKC